MKRLIALMMILLSSSAFAADLDKSFPVEGAHLFMIEHTSGNITITGTDDSAITVKTHKVQGGDNCFTTTAVSGPLFYMQTSRLDLTIDPCVVNASITLPKTMAVEVYDGIGDVTVQNMAGTLIVRVSAGTLALRGSFTDAILNLGVGKLDGTWQSVANPGAVNFEVGRGKVVLNFPKDAAIATALNPGCASVTTSANVVTEADFNVTGRMRAGVLTVQ